MSTSAVRRARIYERSLGTVPGDSELAFIPAAARRFSRDAIEYVWVALWGPIPEVEWAPCITLQSAKLCARELFTTAEIAVSTHPVLDPAGTLGPRLEDSRKEILMQRIRDSPLDLLDGIKIDYATTIDRVPAVRSCKGEKDYLQIKADPLFRLLSYSITMIKFG